MRKTGDVANCNPVNILAIGHDASLTGAPLLLLSYLREAIQTRTHLAIRALILDGGRLSGQFAKDFDTFLPVDSERAAAWMRLIRRIGQKLRNTGPDSNLKYWLRQRPAPNVIYVNTVASISGLRMVKQCLLINPPVVIHVHELDWLLLKYQEQDNIKDELDRASSIIVPSAVVAEALGRRLSVPSSKIKIIHEWVSKPIDADEYKSKYRSKIRAELGLVSSDTLCVAVGKVQWRKGSDLMALIAKKCTQSNPSIHLAWVGSSNQDEMIQQDLEQSKMGLSQLYWVKEQDDPYPYFAAADIFILPSREDPYPVAMIEAALFGLPIICFEQGGGAPEFIRNGCGIAVPYLDIDLFASAIVALSDQPRKRQSMGEAAIKHALKRHTVQHAEPQISRILFDAARNAELS
jgi:glycosyltransferase involved in cell wall biosynthesis